VKNNSEFLQKKELMKLGFFSVGKDVKISRKISVYKAKGKIGDRVRIDDDVTIKGKISFGQNVHIARGCTISGGKEGVYFDDFSAVSNFVQFFTKSDDYFYPAIPAATLNKNLIRKYSRVHSKKIVIGKAVLIGAMSTILPGANIMDFASVGAYSVVYKKIEKGTYYCNHNKIIKKKRNLIEMQKKFLQLKNLLNKNSIKK
jgi:acetyltransferase-like isoleucine patch superfamily enzyme